MKSIYRKRLSYSLGGALYYHIWSYRKRWWRRGPKKITDVELHEDHVDKVLAGLRQEELEDREYNQLLNDNPTQ